MGRERLDMIPRLSRILEHIKNNDTAVGFLCVFGAAILLSLIPLVIDISGTTGQPLTVGSGVVCGFLVFNIVVQRNLPISKHADFSPTELLKRARSPQVGLRLVLIPLSMTAVGGLTYMAFAWSIVYIDPAVSSSLYELWPIVWFISMKLIDRNRHGPHELKLTPWSHYILMSLAILAIVLVVYSTGANSSDNHDTSIPVVGVILALIAPVLGSFTTCTFLFIDRMMYGRTTQSKHHWESNGIGQFKRREIEEYLGFVAGTVTRISLLPIVVLIAILESFAMSTWRSAPFLGGVVAGAMLNGPAAFLLRRSHIVSHQREIIVLQYLAPIFALLWLAWLRGIDIIRIDFLVFGTVAIVAINMLINVDPERRRQRYVLSPSTAVSSFALQYRAPVYPIQERYSLKALVVTLLGIGMFIYFRDRLIADSDLIWTGSDYWAILALASTVFALLLAFRLTRVESLLQAEDHRTLSLIRRIEMLPKSIFVRDTGVDSARNLITWIRQVNSANSLSDYRRAYNNSQRLFQQVIDRLETGEIDLGGEDRSEIGSIRAELDALARGRQHAREFAERIALWLMGGMIVVLSLGAPTQPSEWARLLSDVFVVLLASVVVFLLFHLADIRRSRADELLMDRDPDWESLPEGLYVRFRNDRDLRWQRIFAGLIILGIVATIIGLLAADRLMIG